MHVPHCAFDPVFRKTQSSFLFYLGRPFLNRRETSREKTYHVVGTQKRGMPLEQIIDDLIAFIVKKVESRLPGVLVEKGYYVTQWF